MPEEHPSGHVWSLPLCLPSRGDLWVWGGDRNYYHNHYNSSSITGTLLGGSISINSNSHNNYDKEALFSRDEETGLNRSIISPRLHDWPVKWDSHPLPPLLTFSPLPSNTLRLFTKMAAGIPPIPVCPFVIWTCCLSRRDLGGGKGERPWIWAQSCELFWSTKFCSLGAWGGRGLSTPGSKTRSPN